MSPEVLTMSDPLVYRRQRQAMVETQLESRGIRAPEVLAAFQSVPRHEFVVPGDEPVAYQDRALPIGWGQTISQPFMVAYMLEMLAVESHHRVLEVGAGSGYQAALLGQIASEVYAIEIVQELALRAQATVSRLGYTKVHIVQGDGSLGYPAQAPYDRIVVAAGAPAIPEPLVSQLVEGGRLVIPLGDRGLQTCMVGVKREGELSVERGIGCVFVPLVGEKGWRATC
jgi:protein-L-isoaspartate(D-aspartate) O-methyltransferase